MKTVSRIPVLAPHCFTSKDPAELPLSTMITYDARDPFAVTLTLTTAGVDWVFARELLADGIDGAAGMGDVYVCADIADPDIVRVTLLSPTDPDCWLTLGYRRVELEYALLVMERAVPAGTEAGRIDWGRELAALGGEVA